MISAKLSNELKNYGFELDLPRYNTTEEIIIEILNQNNERLDIAIPLLLEKEFNYERIINKINASTKKRLNKILLITDQIFNKENIQNIYLRNTIHKYKIKTEYTKDEFQYYYNAFKDSKHNVQEEKEEYTLEQIQIRSILNRNLALSNIFSLGKQKIMEKIYNHEQLTNTELKYYYRSIRPLILSIFNDNMQKYLRIIESTKKYTKK